MQFKLLTTASAAMLMVGCSTSITRHVENNVANTDQQITSIIRDTQDGGNPVRTAAIKNGVRHVNQVWMPLTRVNEDETRHAAVLSRAVSVNRRFDDIGDAASYITGLTGIAVYVTLDAKKAANELVGLAEGGAGATASAGAGLPPAPGMGGGSATYGNSQAAELPSIAGLITPISYSGKLSGFLDILTSRYGLFWEVDKKGGVRLFKTKTETFRLAGLPGSSEMSTKVGTQSSGSTSGGGEGGLGGTSGSLSTASADSEQSTGIKAEELSVWKAVEEGINAMLSADGKVVVTAATGTITVNDTPPVIEKVAEYIQNQNTALKRQILLNVRVLSVDLNNSEAYGINWDAVYKNVSSGVNTALGTTSGLGEGMNSLSFNIFKTKSGAWDGTKVILEALSKQGRVSQITSASVMTMNNQPAPLQVGRQRSYLASSTTSIGTGGAGNTTTIQPGVVSTGFSLSVLPHILDGGKLLLQYSANISALVGLETVTSGEATIQTPEIDTRNFLQRVMLNNGETLALAGFEQVSGDGTRRGIGSPNNLLLGGGVDSKTGKSVIVVLIQPVMNAVN